MTSGAGTGQQMKVTARQTSDPSLSHIVADLTPLPNLVTLKYVKSHNYCCQYPDQGSK